MTMDPKLVDSYLIPSRRRIVNGTSSLHRFERAVYNAAALPQARININHIYFIVAIINRLVGYITALL